MATDVIALAADRNMGNVTLEPTTILRLRLANEHLREPRLADPCQLVAHLGAVQSQDYPAALWALGLRLRASTFATIEQAFNAGSILRTHVLRPTWHFVSPEDIRWMLALSGPRILRRSRSRHRELGITPSLAGRSAEVIFRTLEGGHALTRAEIGQALSAAGVEVSTPGLLTHLILCCELNALVCSGPLRGRSHTWMLLEERARGPRRDLVGEQAIAELACRYFTSHGPATLNDFAWWSGITISEGRGALAALGSRMVSATVEGKTYWYSAATAEAACDVGAALQANAALQAEGAALLLPNFDEYTVAFRSRELFFPREVVYRPGPRDDGAFSNLIVIDGVAVGFWKRRVPRDAATVEPRWFEPASPAHQRAFEAAAARYAAFFGPDFRRDRQRDDPST